MNLLFTFFLFVVSVGAAPRTNPGFETGTLDGWEVVGDGDAPYIATSLEGNDGLADFAYYPEYGTYFAVIPGGSFTNSIQQEFSGKKGDIISGKAAFVAIDYLPFDDEAVVMVLQGSEVLYKASISSTGDASTPWTPFSYVLKNDGKFTIKAMTTNDRDYAVDSFLLMDTAETCTPELMSWNLWDADANKVDQILVDGTTICLPDNEISIEAYYGECGNAQKNPIDRVIIRVCINGKCESRTERQANYFSWGNTDKTTFVNGRDAKEGTYVLKATAVDGGIKYVSELTFNMEDCSPP